MRNKLPPDPENLNDERALWAAVALRHFQRVTCADDEDALGDLLCDLMHWSDRNNFDFEAAKALTPDWMQNIHSFDALEIHPCAVIGHDDTGSDIVEQCEPKDAHFWTVFGHFRTGGVTDFGDFATEAEAISFQDRLIALWPHLAELEG